MVQCKTAVSIFSVLEWEVLHMSHDCHAHTVYKVTQYYTMLYDERLLCSVMKLDKIASSKMKLGCAIVIEDSKFKWRFLLWKMSKW